MMAMMEDGKLDTGDVIYHYRRKMTGKSFHFFIFPSSFFIILLIGYLINTSLTSSIHHHINQFIVHYLINRTVYLFIHYITSEIRT